MTVSVVVPAFNAELWLARALESIVHQSYRVNEVIVVDDGSTDGTGKIVGRYSIHGVRYIYQDNAGVAAARNRGISASNGEWIAFLDSDDEWFPKKIEKQVELLKHNPSVMWCCCNGKRSARDLRDGQSVPLSESYDHDSGEISRFFEAVNAGMFFQTSGMMINRSVFLRLGCFDAGLKTGEDRDLWYRIGMYYPEIACCREECYVYHAETVGSLMKTSRDRTGQLRSICRNIRLARELGVGAGAEFERIAHRKAYEYMLRAIAGDVVVDREVVEQTKALIQLSLKEKVLITIVARLPRKLARRLINW